jgi:hypothetical protein
MHFYTPMRIATLLVSACVLAQLPACGRIETIRVGANTFCVPKDNLIEPTGWLRDATRRMPQDGFAFVIPADLLAKGIQYQSAPNIKGEPMPISGTLQPVRNDEWLSRLSPDNYWRRLAEGPGAIIELDAQLHHIRAFQTSIRDKWMVWGIDRKFDLQPSSIGEGGWIVAHCDRTDFRTLSPRQVDETTICQRRTTRDSLFLSYSFGERNLPRLADVDSEVWKTVLSWQCKEP